MIVKPATVLLLCNEVFESSVNSYDSQTSVVSFPLLTVFESSVNSYDSQTILYV